MRTFKKVLALLLSFLILNLQLFAQRPTQGSVLKTNCQAWDKASFYKGEEVYVNVHWTGEIYWGKGHGYGIAYFPDGSLFEGTLINGVPEGVSKYYDAKTTHLCIGNFTKGVHHGEVVSVLSTGVYIKTGLFSGIEIKYFAGYYPYRSMPRYFYAYNSNGKKVGEYHPSGDGKYTLQAPLQGDIITGLLGAICGTALFLAGATAATAAVALAATPAVELFWLIIIIP